MISSGSGSYIISSYHNNGDESLQSQALGLIISPSYQPQVQLHLLRFLFYPACRQSQGGFMKECRGVLEKGVGMTDAIACIRRYTDILMDLKSNKGVFVVQGGSVDTKSIDVL
jgi:hypothetical protein